MYINRDVSEELELIDRIRDEVDQLAEVLDSWGPLPKRTIQRFETISNSLQVLENMLKESNTYLIIRDNDTNKEEIKYFTEGDYCIFHEASRYYAFSDCDDTYSIVKIVFEGREVSYCGWDFGMHFVYKYRDNAEVAYENWFPQWDH